MSREGWGFLVGHDVPQPLYCVAGRGERELEMGLVSQRMLKQHSSCGSIKLGGHLVSVSTTENGSEMEERDI